MREIAGYSGSLEIAPSVIRPDSTYIHTGKDGAHIYDADFLAAVEAECDVIIVRRADLLPVDPEVNGEGAVVGYDYIGADDAAEARKWALHYLSLADYYDTHPPINEAQVVALGDLIRPIVIGSRSILPGFSDDLARSLYLAGVRVPEVTR